MAEFRTIARIKATNVRSLAWSGDAFIDWAGGGGRFQLDGTFVSSSVFYAYRFDACCISCSGKYAVIYERLGTKGLLLREGELLRELNRSYYFADVHEYPVCFGRLNSGREVLMHCPNEYNQLEIDDVETGVRLTQSESREPFDFFHSRLAADSTNGVFLSAGWIWHPVDALCVYKLDRGIADPRSLDASGLFPNPLTEISSAVFLDHENIVIASTDESVSEDELTGNVLGSSSIGVWNIPTQRLVSNAVVSEPIGTLMPVGNSHVVGFYKHPKIIDLKSGAILSRMTDVDSGMQTSSIIHHVAPIPPLAMDAKSMRFAVASDSEVVIAEVKLDP